MNDNYPYKHWLATILTGCFFLAVYHWLANDNQVLEPPGIFFFSLLFGCLFSLPALLFYVLFFGFIVKKGLTVKQLKTILVGFVVIEIILTFLIMGGGLLNSIFLSYSLAAVSTGIFLRLSQKARNGKAATMMDIN